MSERKSDDGTAGAWTLSASVVEMGRKAPSLGAPGRTGVIEDPSGLASSPPLVTTGAFVPGRSADGPAASVKLSSLIGRKAEGAANCKVVR